jgi:hypothetical protein
MKIAYASAVLRIDRSDSASNGSRPSVPAPKRRLNAIEANNDFTDSSRS